MNFAALSTSWQTARLEELAELVRGLAFPTNDKRLEKANGLIACLRTANVQQEVDWTDLWFIPRKHLRHEKQLVREGDILISTANSYELVGKVAQIRKLPTEATLGAFISLIRPAEHLHPGYIFYQLLSSEAQQHIREMASTTTNISNVSTSKLSAVVLKIAPRAEQDRIVAEIEKQFTRLDDAVSALKRVKANLKRYRASVLKAACEGRLVPTEAELARKESRDYEPASELLKRILAERRTKWEAGQLQKMMTAGKPPKHDEWKQKYRVPESLESLDFPELPIGWEWSSVDQLATEEDYALAIGPFGSNLKVSDYTPTGVPLIFIRNIRSRDFSDTTSRFISQQKARELHPHSVRSGDLLITKMGDPPGDVCIYPDNRPPAVITADCIKLRLHPFLRSKRFFEIAFSSESSRKQILLRTKGVAQLKISLARFKTVAVPLPPEAEQLRIAAEVERRFSILANAVNEVERQIIRAKRLRQSILARAFSGKLVPQDPDDDAASVLLERIRAERKNPNLNSKNTGSTIDTFFGTWPGDETDEELLEALMDIRKPQRQKARKKLAQPVRAGKQ